MTTRTLCEATAMDVARFGSWDDAVPPCGEPAVVDVDGYLLCRGCAQALAELGRLGRVARVARVARAGLAEDLRRAARVQLVEGLGRDLLFVLAVVVAPAVGVVALSLAAALLLAALGVR